MLRNPREEKILQEDFEKIRDFLETTFGMNHLDPHGVGRNTMIRNSLAAVWMILCVPLANAAQGMAASSIRYLPDLKLWVLETERTSYVVGVNEQLQTSLLGSKDHP